MSRRPLELSDVEHLIAPSPPGLDETTAEYLRSMKIQIKQRQISLLNKHLDELFEIYPQGNSLLFFVGLEMCSTNIKKLMSNLGKDDFIANLLEQARVLGLNRDDEANSSAISEYGEIQLFPDAQFDAPQAEENEELSDDSGSETENSNNVHKTRWNEEEKNRFIEICETMHVIKSWNDLVYKMGNKTVKQVKMMFAKLRNAGKLQDVTVSIRKGRKKRGDAHDSVRNMNNIGEMGHITGMLFFYRTERSYVGDKSYKFIQNMIESPLLGYEDMISGKPLSLPMISPYGTVLNRETWVNCQKISGTSELIDPFIQQRIHSMRELVFLTAENFDYYKGKIKNIELKK